MKEIKEKIKLKTHKDLVAWQKAYKLCLNTFKLVKTFPKAEEFGLVSQIKRSALSIPSNIAEGYHRRQTKEYIRFLYIGYSSLAELDTQLSIAKDLNYITPHKVKSVFDSVNEVQRILFALIRSIKNLKSSDPVILKSSEGKAL